MDEQTALTVKKLRLVRKMKQNGLYVLDDTIDSIAYMDMKELKELKRGMESSFEIIGNASCQVEQMARMYTKLRSNYVGRPLGSYVDYKKRKRDSDEENEGD